MAKGKASKKSSGRNPELTAALKKTRQVKWDKERAKWANDPVYMRKQEAHLAKVAKAKEHDIKKNGKATCN